RHARDVRVAARRPAADLQRSAQGSAHQHLGGAVERHPQADHVAGSRVGYTHRLFPLRDRRTEGNARGTPAGRTRAAKGGSMNDDNLIERYHPADRANHWLTAITFILLALSGLALFHPAFFFLSHLFGDGPWMRILHPFIGILMAVSFYFLAHRFFADDLMTG